MILVPGARGYFQKKGLRDDPDAPVPGCPEDWCFRSVRCEWNGSDDRILP